MPFFINFFTQDFRGNWVLGDRQYTPEFLCGRNNGRGDDFLVSFGSPPFNLSGNDADGNAKNILNLSFAMNDPINWTDLAVTITGATLSAIVPSEVITSLQAVGLFNDFFTVALSSNSIQIRQKYPVTRMRCYIKKGQAEEAILFNKMAGVAELPNYFARHTIANRYNYPDGQNLLIQLNPGGSTVDTNIINSALDSRGKSLNLTAATVQLDYQLLRGRSGIFNFSVNTVDGSNRITQTISYPSGAKAGDLGKLTKYYYTGANTFADKVTEQPYTLASGDIVSA